MNETLWLLLILFGFAVVAQTLAHLFTLRRSLRELEEEVAESTQTIFESRRKNEWLEARVQDLLDAAQLKSGDPQDAWRRLESVIRRTKADAMAKGYNVGLGDIDQPD
jgi:K+-sensing histidine kinase KdpD